MPRYPSPPVMLIPSKSREFFFIFTLPNLAEEGSLHVPSIPSPSPKKGFIAIAEEKVAITLRRKVAITLKAGCYYPKSATCRL